MIIFNPRFLFLAVFAAAVTIAYSSSDECVYTIYVAKRGSVIKAGNELPIGARPRDFLRPPVSLPDARVLGGLHWADPATTSKARVPRSTPSAARGPAASRPRSAAKLPSYGAGPTAAAGSATLWR
ncbi:uncharacterized protein A4U43_C04F32920 [Asparagus officinalis]|uniref:Uncharacterized protein n=1 Tax=Asparagus officinalis TaxID=4686 RepID=A0A5P1FAL8_ASPOF|nr:uncharacterized protein A4U43_C04F32920 [Asparagus officinalis]